MQHTTSAKTRKCPVAFKNAHRKIIKINTYVRTEGENINERM